MQLMTSLEFNNSILEFFGLLWAIVLLCCSLKCSGGKVSVGQLCSTCTSQHDVFCINSSYCEPVFNLRSAGQVQE